MATEMRVFPDLRKVKERREELELTQKELAEKCGVSQSTIAKIEAEKVNPSYEVMRTIFSTLNRIEADRKKDLRAKDVMTKNVIGVEQHDEIRKAIAKMKEHDFSQLPIFSEEVCVGSISEETILELVSQETDLDEIYEKRVKDVMKFMGEAFPRVSTHTPLSVIMCLLGHSHAVLVTHREKTVGIITKADLLDLPDSSKKGST